MNGTILNDELETLLTRCASKAAEISEVEQELKSLVSAIVDADPKARPALISKRGELANLIATLGDELKELSRRAEVSKLAPFELAAIQAEGLVRLATDEATCARHARDDAAKSWRIFMNQRRGATPERDQKRIELETALAREKAKGLLAAQALERAKYKLESAKNRLDTERQRLAEVV